MIRSLLVMSMAGLVLSGCATQSTNEQTGDQGSSSVQQGNAAGPGAPGSITYVPAPGSQSGAGAGSSSLHDQLVGKTYIKGKDYPAEIADGWQVSQQMLLPGKNRGSFFSMTKDGTTVLVSARAEKKISASQHEYIINDALPIPAVDFAVAGASCAPRHSTARSVYALLDMGARRQIVWAANVEPGSDKIVELPAGKSNKYLCRFRDGNKTVSHTFIW